MPRSTRHDILPSMRALLAVALTGLSGLACGSTPRPAPLAAPAAPALAAPPAIDPGARGAPYLTAVARELQPRWAQFLDDCRLRLPPTHPLNTQGLEAHASLVIDRSGRVVDVAIAPSGNPDFDRAVADVVEEVAVVEVPPFELLSDDDQLHLAWLFARDARQAGPATATVERRVLPITEVISRLLATGALPRAARRVLTIAPGDPVRLVTAELVMHAALREALAGDAVARRAAVHAIGRANIQALAPDLRALLVPTTDAELRRAVIDAVVQLHDEAAVEPLAALLAVELPGDSRAAASVTSAMVQLGARARAAAAIRAALEQAPTPAALRAHAVAPTPALAARLETWFSRGDAGLRASVCDAVPAGVPSPVVAAGLRDRDATVRSACLEAAARVGKTRGKAHDVLVDRVEMRLDDRDVGARARAVAALAVLRPLSARRGLADPAAEVRIAAVPAASDAALRTLAGDREAEVRAAAVIALGGRLADVTSAALTDPAAQVRAAALRTVTDTGQLSRMTSDPMPEIATEALIRMAAHRSRTAGLAPALQRLSSSPTAGPERVRIALAWLVAPTP